MRRHLLEQQRLEARLPNDILGVTAERLHFGDERIVEAARRAKLVHGAPVFVGRFALAMAIDHVLDELPKRGSR